MCNEKMSKEKIILWGHKKNPQQFILILITTMITEMSYVPQDKFAMIKMYLDDYLKTISNRRSSYKFITV